MTTMRNELTKTGRFTRIANKIVFLIIAILIGFFAGRWIHANLQMGFTPCNGTDGAGLITLYQNTSVTFMGGVMVVPAAIAVLTVNCQLVNAVSGQ